MRSIRKMKKQVPDFLPNKATANEKVFKQDFS